MARLPVREIVDEAARARNRDRWDSDAGYPCIVCGRPCKAGSTAAWVWLHEGGSTIVDQTEGERLNAEGHGDADLGYYPIGRDCYRKHKGKLAPFVHS